MTTGPLRLRSLPGTMVCAALVPLAACGGPMSGTRTTVHGNTGGGGGGGAVAGSARAPFPVRPGLGVDVAIPSIAGAPPAFALDARADLVLRWTDPGGFAVVGPDGITTDCATSPCVLPLALAGAYFAEARGGWHEPPPAPVRVTARLLAPPPAVTLVPGAGPVELHLAPATAGDPRGALADASLHLPITAGVTLELDEPGAAAATADALLSRVGVGVFGPGGTAMSIIGGSARKPGALTVSFDGLPGDYTVRLTATAADLHALRVVTRALGPIVNQPGPVKAAPAPAASVPRLATDRDRLLVIAPAPEPPSVWIDTPAGFDLALTWTTGAWLAVTRPEREDGCDPSPCVLARWPAGPAALSVKPGDGPVRAHARVWPLPAPAGVLHGGDSLELTTAAAGPDDPRGPLAEVELALERDGTYDVEARDLDWVAPVDWHDAHLPRVEVFAVDGAYPEHPFGLLTSGADLRDGIGRDEVQLDGPAHLIVRVDGRGPRAPRRVRVSVTRR